MPLHRAYLLHDDKRCYSPNLIRLESNTNLPSTIKKKKKNNEKNLLAGMDLNCTVWSWI